MQTIEAVKCDVCGKLIDAKDKSAYIVISGFINVNTKYKIEISNSGEDIVLCSTNCINNYLTFEIGDNIFSYHHHNQDYKTWLENRKTKYVQPTNDENKSTFWKWLWG